MENTASATTRFGLDLFNTITCDQSSSNAFISPFSLSTALSMTQLGANGSTAAGMVKALRWEKEKEAVIHEENGKYMALLEKGGEEYSLSVANRLYVEQGYPLLPTFLQQTKDHYLAEAVPAHFKANPEKERLTINDWVSTQTQDRIKDLIAAGVLTANTRMVLVNAIYFKGFWTTPFKATSTRPRLFKVSASVSKNVPTMTLETSFSFWMDDGKEGLSALEMPYKGDGLSLVILLPTADSGLEDMEKTLSVEKMNSIFSRLKDLKKVKLFLPKFEMTCSYRLKEPLCKLGMAEAFDVSRADFSRMTEGRDLCVSEVVHKAFVKVDEEGSEAAAATAVSMMMRSMMMNVERVPEFVVDHPFFFVIRDKRASDSILFMGRVVDPSK